MQVLSVVEADGEIGVLHGKDVGGGEGPILE